MRLWTRLGCVTLAVLVTRAGAAHAQIPETFKNLEVLPKDIRRPELIGVMREFAGSLGVRCVHCHEGEDLPDLKGVDFASDAKEVKRTARAMMKMVRAINDDYIRTLGRKSPVQVGCVTCHRGIAKPRTLDAELALARDEKGVDGMVARYRELRERFYGQAAYDFGPVTLDWMAERRMHEAPAEAVVLLDLNIEAHPDRAWTRFLMGEARRALGEVEAARASYEKALALEPGHVPAKQRLATLGASPSPSPSPSPKE